MVFVPLAKATWLFGFEKNTTNSDDFGFNMGLIFNKYKHLMGLQKGYGFGTVVE